jgi:hypothetical protein
MALLTTAEYKLWARNEIPTADDDAIGDAILAAQQALFNAVGRKIVVAGAASARVFAPGTGVTNARVRTGTGGTILWIDDCTSITSISENGVVLSPATYQLEPLNALSESGEALPYDRVRYLNGLTWYENYGQATVSITAAWGWPAIPPQAIEACKIATKAILDGRDIRLGVLAAVDTGAVTERQALVVRNFVSDYRSHKTWGIG